MTVSDTLIQQWQAQSPAEIVAVILAIGYVVMAARQIRWCWPAAFVSTGIYTWLYWENALPLQSLLNAYYLVMAVYGWWRWQQGTQQTPLAVSRRPVGFHLLVIATLVLMVPPLAIISSEGPTTTLNYVDAAITVFSVFTTWLVAQKVLENWIYWFVINTASMWLNWQVEMYLSSLLMLMYLSMSVIGYISWRKDLDNHSIMEPVNS